MQDELLVRLSRIAGLKVISRTSTEKYKSADANLREVAEQLGVTHVLEGSVQKASDRVRITVQLVNAKSDAQLWAETYDRKLSDIFEVQTDVAQRIATSLEAKITGRERREITRVPTTNPEAYDAYLQARAFDGAQTPDDIRRGMELLRKAVELDPNFAIAWAGLARVESEKYFGYIRTPEQLGRARQAAETAMRLQPELAEAHQAMGLFHYYCLQDFDRAIAELNEARTRSPGSADVLLSMAMVTRRQGKLDESIELQQEAANLDPRNLDIWLNLGRSYRGARRFAEAHAMLDRALTIAPADMVATLHKSEVYIAQGDLETAERLTANLEQHPLDDPYGRSVSALTFDRRWDKAIAIVSADVKQKEATSPLGVLGRAIIARFKHAAGSLDAPALLAASEKELLALTAQGPASFRMRNVLLDVTAALGKRGEVDREAEALLRDMAKDRWQLSLCEEAVARAYAIMGDADRAIPLVERALSATGYAALTPAYLRFDPSWDRIRNDPRFEALISGTPPANGAPASPANSVAVLPFNDLSEKKDQEYFCDGVSEEILGALSKIEGLHVAARTSSFAFKGKSADIKQIASALGVQNVLEGSVRREGNRVRVTAQLINAQNGFHLWSQSFDRELQSIFAVQDEMARAIADALKVRLRESRSEAANGESRSLRSLPARDVPFEQERRGRPAQKRRAVRAFHRQGSQCGRNLDWSGESVVLADRRLCETAGGLSEGEGGRAAKRRTGRAQRRGAGLSGRLRTCARSRCRRRGAPVAPCDRVRSEFRLPAPNARAYQAVLGKRDSAVEHLEAALKADPLSPPISNLAGLIWITVGQVDRAIETGRRMLQVDPEYIYQFPMLGPAYAAKGMTTEAIALYRKAQEITGLPQAGWRLYTPRLAAPRKRWRCWKR